MGVLTTILRLSRCIECWFLDVSRCGCYWVPSLSSRFSRKFHFVYSCRSQCILRIHWVCGITLAPKCILHQLFPSQLIVTAEFFSPRSKSKRSIVEYWFPVVLEKNFPQKLFLFHQGYCFLSPLYPRVCFGKFCNASLSGDSITWWRQSIYTVWSFFGPPIVPLISPSFPSLMLPLTAPSPSPPYNFFEQISYLGYCSMLMACEFSFIVIILRIYILLQNKRICSYTYIIQQVWECLISIQNWDYTMM